MTNYIYFSVRLPHSFRKSVNNRGETTQVTKCNWSPWHGSALRGMVCSTWVRGLRVYHEGQFADPGSGQPLQYERGVS